MEKRRARSWAGTVALILLLLFFALQTASPSSANQSDSSSEVIVGFRSDVSDDEQQRLVERTGAEMEERLGAIDAVVVDANGEDRASVTASLEQSSAVEYVEPNQRLTLLNTPNDSGFAQLWGMNNLQPQGFGVLDADIDAPETWDKFTSSGDVLVAVIDTGIDYNHPDLKENIWSNPGEVAGNGVDDDGNDYVDDIHGYDFFNNDSNPADDHYHGTHVAGTIGAVGNNGVGVAGVAWKSKLLGLKFLSSGGYGYLSDAVRAINYATAIKKKLKVPMVLNNSWGGGGYSYALNDAIQNATKAKIVFVAAAGNSGRDNGYYAAYPANYSNVVSVAASTQYEALAYFSNYGRYNVHLAAPGYGTYSTTPNYSYGYASGTSMASPHVAGAVALYLANNPNATPLSVRDALIYSVDKFSSYDNTVSRGRLNLARLLGIEPATAKPPAKEEPAPKKEEPKKEAPKPVKPPTTPAPPKQDNPYQPPPRYDGPYQPPPSNGHPAKQPPTWTPPAKPKNKPRKGKSRANTGRSDNGRSERNKSDKSKTERSDDSGSERDTKPHKKAKSSKPKKGKSKKQTASKKQSDDRQ